MWARLDAAELCEQLERCVVERLGCSYALAVADVRQGLDLVLHVLGLRAGSELVTSPLCWPWMLDVFLRRALTLHYAPIRAFDLNLDPDALEKALPARRPALLVSHFAGAPTAMTEIREQVAGRGGFVIEEGAYALGARSGDAWIGSRGTCILALPGLDRRVERRGAVITLEDARLAEAMREERSRRDAGIGLDHAVFALAGMRKEEFLWLRRQEIGRVYDRALEQLRPDGVERIGASIPEAASRMYYPILVRQRRRLAEALLDARIEVDVPRLLLPRGGRDLWISAAARLIGLPIHVAMQPRDAERVVQVLERTTGRR